MLPLLVIAGPTGVGKSEIAVGVAEKLDGEVIGADSRQIYRGLDILTGKPGRGLRARVRHRLVSSVNGGEPVSAARYAELAERALRSCRRRGKLPVVCGGSGLYIRALIQGLFPGGAPEPALRRRLERELAARGVAAMHRRLARVDPESASRLAAADARRVLRALEVYEGTGRPIGLQREEGRRERPARPTVLFVLTRPRQELYARIERRVDGMVEQGLLAEARRAARRKLHPLLKESLGLRALLEHLAGRLALTEALARMKKESRNYAKRQLTWFRGEKDAVWIDLSEVSESKAIGRIVSGYRGSSKR